MRAGGGKGKGSSYEREICRRLSLWVTAGAATDVFWRSAMSGGRATVAHKKGQVVRQAGDITAVSPEGHSLCSRYYIECKHYKDLDIQSFFLTGKGLLAKFWKTTVREAKKHGRYPVLIVRQNRVPDLVLARPVTLSHVLARLPEGTEVRVRNRGLSGRCTVWFFDDLVSCSYVTEAPPLE